MKALFIGGTGVISTAISNLAVAKGWELYLLNRGNRTAPKGAHTIVADISNAQDVRKKIEAMQFDVVVDFIAYTCEEVQRDIELFEDKTGQYIFISSASAYQKPLSSFLITEGTPLANPYWQYSRDKIDCEDALMAAYRKKGFPVTIVRPSHTYSNTRIPVAIHGKKGSFAVVDRIRQGKKVIVPGDGLTHWTLTHSNDFAVAFCGLMGNPHALGESFHITGDECITWNQVYEAIGRAFGVKPQITHIPADMLAKLCPSYFGSLLGDKSNNAVFDNTKIKRAVPEFCATIRFDQGVRDAVQYIYQHSECRELDPEFDAWCDALTEEYEGMASKLPRYDMQ